METLARFYTSLIGNIALLLVAMPVIGAVIVRLMQRSGREPVYFTALTNVWICCGLVTLAVLQFDQRSGFESLYRPQMLTSLPWPGLADDGVVDQQSRPVSHSDQSDSATVEHREQEGGVALRVAFPRPRFSVGINGLNLWLIAITVAAATLAVRGIDLDRDSLASRLSWVLLTEATLIGSLAAQDVVLLSGFNLLSVFCLFALIGQSTHADRRVAARQFFRVQFCAALLLSIGLVAAAVSHWWMTLAADVVSPVSFSVNLIVARMPGLAVTSETARVFWNSVSPWLFVLICSACVLRLAVPPLHHWWLRTAEQSDRATAALIACGYLPAGLYVVARIVVPLFAERLAMLGPHLLTWAMLAAVLSALAGIRLASGPDRSTARLTSEHAQRIIGVALVVCLAIAFGALITVEPVAVRGALLLTVSACAGAGLAFWMLPVENASAADGPVTDRLSGAFRWLAVCGLVLAPVSGSFWGLLMVLNEYSRHSVALTLLMVLTCVVFSGRVLQMARAPWSAGIGRRSSNRQSQGLLGLLPLACILVISAVSPTLICRSPPPAETAGTSAKSESAAVSPSIVNRSTADNRDESM
ncbi:MAG: hypothetical protein ACYTGL_02535 [Planctomycetota bacterium]|jgi:NADH:ubiquinone oxidoreductase subunit 4 (subunit M)